MATAEVVTLMDRTYPHVEPVLQAMSIDTLSMDDFDPKKHIDFTPPANILTMSDLKLPEGTGVSPFAVSDPFQLFTQEAVQRMRVEIFSKEVMENCKYSSNLAQCQLRGFAAKSVKILAKLFHLPSSFPHPPNFFDQVCALCVRCVEESGDAGDHLQNRWC